MRKTKSHSIERAQVEVDWIQLVQAMSKGEFLWTRW